MLNVAEQFKPLLDIDFSANSKPLLAQVQHKLRAIVGDQPRSGIIDLAIEKLISGGDFDSPQEASAVFSEIVDGQLADDQIGAILVLLLPDRLKSSTIAAFASVMRDKAKHVSFPTQESLGDTCGTGSDTVGTYNVSTTIAFILAAAGIKIAKHGNRAITSQCGSADVLEELGVRIELTPEQVTKCIRDVGIGFMFAPAFHESFRNVQRIRRAIATEVAGTTVAKRTVFNVLGPLSNPAGAKWQILGVYDKGLSRKFAESLRDLGVARALIPFGEGDPGGPGLDEFSTCGTTFYAELASDGSISDRVSTPGDVGLAVAPTHELLGGSRSENAAVLREVLSGKPGPKTDLALYNAGAGLYVAEQVDSIAEGVQKARGILSSGSAIRKLDELVAVTRNMSGDA